MYMLTPWAPDGAKNVQMCDIAQHRPLDVRNLHITCLFCVPLSRIMDPLVPDHSNVGKLAMHLALGSAGSEVLTGRLNKYCLVIGWLRRRLWARIYLDNCRLAEDYYSHISCNCGLYKLINFILQWSVFNAANRKYGRRNSASSFVLNLAVMDTVMYLKCRGLFSSSRHEFCKPSSKE